MVAVANLPQQTRYFDSYYLQGCKDALAQWRGARGKNTENLAELLFSFWESYDEYFSVWNDGLDR